MLAPACIAASALLALLFARGGMGWLLGFVVLVPWLRLLDARPALVPTLVSAYAMSVAYTLAVFAWFGVAVGNYTGVGGATGLAILALAAPILQPQFFAFALVRYATRSQFGPIGVAMAAAAAWVATEWCVPKLLGVTLGYGLYPSATLRQAAEFGGAAGLTVMLLWANEGFAAATARWPGGLRALWRPVLAGALLPLMAAGYGAAHLANLPAVEGKPVRLGLVQANMVDYERQRQERGTYAVVREALNLHFAMSYDAVERHQVDAVVWSETAYPTTFGHPKSEAGAQLDREILSIVDAAGVPFVFGTYDRDVAGEYNAAAFVQPGVGLLGLYRKTHLFPLTEYVPEWLDCPALRQWLPWTGSWRPGDGARVYPLQLRDGREIPVLPLICLDDLDSTLAVNGARLGAQAILTLSNDSWFTATPQGVQLHHAIAAFRSIETRLPQFRVTTNGFSAAIDATGAVIAGGQLGQRTLVIGELFAPIPPPTLMVRWGDWVGRFGAVFLALLLIFGAWRKWAPVGVGHAGSSSHLFGASGLDAFPAKAVALPMGVRFLVALLRVFARGSLLWIGAMMLLSDQFQSNTLAQIRWVSSLFLLPEAVAWCVLQAFSGTLSVENGVLVLTRGQRRMTLALTELRAVTVWWLPLPGLGVTLHMAPGSRWPRSLMLAEPTALRAVWLKGADFASGGAATTSSSTRFARLVQAWQWASASRFASLWAKYLLLPMLLALPAFRLHQHIAYGGSFGEYYTFGLQAYLTTLALWWAAWAIGVLLCAAALRAAIEVATLIVVGVRPELTLSVRIWLERFGLLGLYVGVPGWLVLRAFGN